MSKYTTIFAVIAGLVLALAPAAQAAPIVTPGDGYTGAYRIAFVTTGTTNPQSSDITTYNTYVTAAAAAVTELNALGATWKCIGSTVAVSAKVNTGTDVTGGANDVPIYTTTGLRIADDNADLWDGGIANPIWYDDGSTLNHGDPWSEPYDPPGDQTWTGTSTDGTSDGNGSGISQDQNAMGTGFGKFPDPINDPTNYITLVRGGYTDGNWITGPSDHENSVHHLMGMSSVIPEPATMSLLAIGGLGVLLKRRRRA